VRCYVIVTISNLLVLFILVPCFRFVSSTFCTYVISFHSWPLRSDFTAYRMLLQFHLCIATTQDSRSVMPLIHFSIHLVVFPYHHCVVKDIYYSPYDAPYFVYYGFMAGIYSNYFSAPVVRGNRFAHIYIQWYHHHASRLKDKSQRQYKTC
jgi:hypothetical protein